MATLPGWRAPRLGAGQSWSTGGWERVPRPPVTWTCSLPGQDRPRSMLWGATLDTQCPWREPRCTRAYCRREWGGVLAWSRNEGVTDQSLRTPPLRRHSKAGAHPGLTPCPHAAGSSLPNPNRALTTEPHMTATLSNSCLFPFFRTELLGSGRAWCRPLASCPADPAARKPSSGCHTF